MKNEVKTTVYILDGWTSDIPTDEQNKDFLSICDFVVSSQTSNKDDSTLVCCW